ncbi:MAG: MFS transporter [Actinobacteria bacterium]|nr:MFS transporter [Actinomycetota bacterium]
MLQRALDDSYPAEVRDHITLLTGARTCANACFRFAPPFLATIAAGQGTSLDRIGVALAVSELSGLASPLTARVADRFHRRTAMTAGLVGVGLGATLAGLSGHLVVFTVALVVLAQSKVMFDLGLASWVSDRVPFERRGRVIGLTETSWALGLLLGVTTMGLITATTSWRIGYAAGAVAVVAMAGLVVRAIPDDGVGQGHADRPRSHARIVPRGWVVAAAVFCLMAASQFLFVTFGSWLQDHAGLTDTGVSIVVFGLGFGELLSSLSAARYSDRWGKERAAAIGAGIMIPAALGLALAHGHTWIGLPLLVVAIAAFEFGIVSAIPLSSEIVPGAPARGMALTLAVGTLGRAVASIPATRLYVRHGMAWPAVMCAVLAGGGVLAMGRARAMRPVS